MKMVDMPKLEDVSKENCATYILDFYEALGWDEDTYLDSALIKMNATQWMEICNQFATLGERKLGFQWIHIGPSGDTSIPYGKIGILPGAFRRDS